MVLEENMASLNFSNRFCPVKKVLKQNSYISPLWESFKNVKEYSVPSIFNECQKNLFPGRYVFGHITCNKWIIKLKKTLLLKTFVNSHPKQRITTREFLCAFANLRNATTSFVIWVYLCQDGTSRLPFNSFS